MALAQRLNELAVANSEGLLNDDEYRLLRRNLFEEHSAGTLDSSPSYQPIPPIHIVQDAPIKSPKSPTSLSFSSLLRRATGRWSSGSSTSKTTKRPPDGPRKPPPLVLQAAARTSMATTVSTPSSSSHYGSISPSNLSTRQISSPTRDAFEKTSLVSAAEIRAALSSTEEECHKLTGAFNDLEANTLRRIRKRRARRLPMNTPPSVDVVLAGGEWRGHRLLSPPSSPIRESNSRDHLRLTEAPSTLAPPLSPPSKPKGGLLMRSASHIGLRKPSSQPSKEASDQMAPPPDRRKHASGRNLATSSSSFVLGRTADMNRHSSQQRGSRYVHEGHLSTSHSIGPGYIHTASEIDPLDDDDEYAEDTQSIANDMQALEDVRRKRDDLVSRYAARLEFLRAKLKSAEMQERLRKR